MPQRRCRSRSQADLMSIHDEAEDARRNTQTCLALARSNYSNKHPPPQCRRLLDLYVIVSSLILGAFWPWNYFLEGAYIRNNTVIQMFIQVYNPQFTLTRRSPLSNPAAMRSPLDDSAHERAHGIMGISVDVIKSFPFSVSQTCTHNYYIIHNINWLAIQMYVSYI